jgi:hypothetical protein
MRSGLLSCCCCHVTNAPDVLLLAGWQMADVRREMENGRLFRLLVKLGYINERPDGDPVSNLERQELACAKGGHVCRPTHCNRAAAGVGCLLR